MARFSRTAFITALIINQSQILLIEDQVSQRRKGSEREHSVPEQVNRALAQPKLPGRCRLSHAFGFARLHSH